MRPWIVAVALVACHSGSQLVRPKAPETPQPAPRAAVVPEAERGYGPLSIRGKVPETPWPEQQRLFRLHDERYLSAEEMRADVDAFLEVADVAYAPRTDQERENMRVARQVDIIIRLAPYSLDAVGSAFYGAAARVAMCARHTGISVHCHYDMPAPMPPAPEHPYDVTEVDGIGVLTVRDLSDASYAAWAELARDTAPLARASGIVVDLRAAWGDDPRPLIPWLEQLTGRAPLRPLRELRRPRELDAYTAAYRNRYAVHARDPEVWSELVGVMPDVAEPPALPPISVVIGPHCESACELVARTLQAYAGATVVGTRAGHGRVGRDDPAVLRLPYSGIDVFFYATEYLLAAEIEAATGATHEWTAGGDDGDVFAYALREVAQRAANPSGWPARCDSFAESLPATPKLEGVERLVSCTEDLHIDVEADLPTSAMRRLLNTCTHPPVLWGGVGQGRHSIGVPRDGTGEAALRQLSHSDVVTRIRVNCEPLPQPTLDVD